MNQIDCSSKDSRVISDLLYLQASSDAGAVWLVDEHEEYSFADADVTSNRVANALVCKGIKPGDVIASIQKASAKAVIFAIGVIKAGGIYAPMSTDCRGIELECAFRECAPKALVVDEEFIPMLDGLESIKSAILFVSGGRLSSDESREEEGFSADVLLEGSPEKPVIELSSDDSVMILRTSGTTGKSKWVTHSNSSLLFMAWTSTVDKTREGDVSYSCTSFNHMAFWTFAVLSPLISGTTGALDDHFTAHKYWNRVRRFNATKCLLLGAMHTYIWNLPPSPEDRSNRVWLAYFSPIKAEMVSKFKKRYGFETMMIGYGSSEIGKVSEGADMDWEGADTAIGTILPYYDVDVFDDVGNKVVDGKVGEICVRPKLPGIIFKGYFKDEEATAQAFRGDWYCTGDLGVRNYSGQMFYCGRKRDSVRHKGRNISLFEIEEIVGRYPGIAEVAAFGVPAEDAVSEEVIALAVVPKKYGEMHPEKLARFIYENAPYYFVPQYIVQYKELPRNKSGRVMKYKLAEGFEKEKAWIKSREEYGRNPKS